MPSQGISVLGLAKGHALAAATPCWSGDHLGALPPCALCCSLPSPSAYGAQPTFSLAWGLA